MSATPTRARWAEHGSPPRGVYYGKEPTLNTASVGVPCMFTVQGDRLRIASTGTAWSATVALTTPIWVAAADDGGDGEPTWRRDVGPFTDSTQAMRQYEAQTHGIPPDFVFRSGPLLVVSEAVMLAGLELTDHEKAVVSANVSAELSVILAGLIIRAAHQRDAPL